MDVIKVVATVVASSVALGAYYYIDPKTPGAKAVATVAVSASAVGLYFLIGPKSPSKRKAGMGASKSKPTGDEVALSKRDYREFKLIKRTEVTHNTRQYRFALQTPQTRLGLPVGQHMAARIMKDGEVVERDYTPISYDGNLGYFDLMIKTYPEGSISVYLDKMKIGETLAFRGPRGGIVYQKPSTFFFPFARIKNRTVSHIGMLAGGTGITPMLQILRQIERDPSDNTKATLMFGNVSPNDILLHEELKEVSANNDNLDIHFIVDKVGEHPNWPGLEGYITPDIIKEYMPPPADDSVILICGPEIMEKKMKEHCENLGYSKEMVRVFK